MKQTYPKENSTQPIAYFCPRSYLDKSYWKLWPEKPNEIIQHQNFEFKWTTGFELGSQYSFTQHITRVTQMFAVYTWYKHVSEETWHEENSIPTYRWQKKTTKEDLQTAIEKSLLLAQKERVKKRNREEIEKLKLEANDIGISIKELKEIKKQKKKEEVNKKKTRKNIDLTEKMLVVGPTLKDIKDQIDIIFNCAKNPETKFQPKNVKNSLKSLSKTLRILE